MIDNEDKQEWCRHGASEELRFCLQFGHTLGLRVNPQKRVDPYAIDLIHESGRLCELKTRNTPFFTAYKSYGLPIQHAVTINRNDVERYYTDYRQLPLYFWSGNAKDSYVVSLEDMKLLA